MMLTHFFLDTISNTMIIALGAKVIAAAGSEEKLDVAKRFGGADFGVNYTKAGWQKEVQSITNGHGVDVVYDPVGLINGMISTHTSGESKSDMIQIL